MSALFNFQSMLMILILMVCTCAYIRQLFPAFIDMNKTGLLGTFYKMARVGERLSPYVSVCCVIMAASLLLS